MSRLTVLHVRNDDGGCDLRIFDATGEEVTDFDVEDVDAGRGHVVEEWEARIAAYEAMPASPLRDAVLDVLDDPPGAEHISGWDER
jgi:hypothetical protein